MKNEKIKNFFQSRTGKSIVVASAALVIGLAVYLNYRWFYDPTSSLGFGDNNMDDNFSDSETTGGDVSESNDYFTVRRRVTRRSTSSNLLPSLPIPPRKQRQRLPRRSRRSPLTSRTRRISKLS